MPAIVYYMSIVMSWNLQVHLTVNIIHTLTLFGADNIMYIYVAVYMYFFTGAFSTIFMILAILHFRSFLHDSVRMSWLKT